MARDGRPGSVRPGQARTATAVLVVLVIVVISAVTVLAISARVRGEAAAVQRTADNYRPPTPSIAPPPYGPVWIITDLPSTGTQAVWSQELARTLHTSVSVLSLPGAGYTATDSSGRNFASAVSSVPVSTPTIVFLGGTADSSSTPTEEARSAAALFGSVTGRSDTTRIIAVGPFAETSSGPESAQIADGIRTAAQQGDAIFVDPTKQGGWVGLRAQAGRPLTGDDQSALARRLAALVIAPGS